jgi:ligand-binding sensor domain-containing protein
MWVGTQSGLCRFPRRPSAFVEYKHASDNRDSLYDNMIYRFNPRTEQFNRYSHNSENPLSLSHNKVNAIREDRLGRLWIGTENGLNLMDLSRGTFAVFTTRDGLPDNAIRAILEDDRGHLWLATHNGLSRFDPVGRRRTPVEPDQ